MILQRAKGTTMLKFNIYAIPNLLTAIFLFVLGFFVFFRNPKIKSNAIFFLLCFSGSIWHFGFFMVFSSVNIQTAMYWNRFVYLGVPFITPLMYHFSISFLKLKKQIRYAYLFYSIALAFVLFSRSPHFITGMHLFFWGYYKKAGPLYLPFMISWFCPAVLVLHNFYSSLQQTASPQAKQRIRYMFIALTISILGVLDFVPGYGIPIYPVGFLLIVVCLSIIAYAILKHQLMDIRVTITRTGIFIAVYTLVLGLPFILAAFGKNMLLRLLGDNWWLGPLFLGTIFAVFGTYAYIYIQKRAEALLLREQRRYQYALKQAGFEMTRIHNIDKLLNFIVETITQTVGISYVTIYLSQDNNTKLILKASRNQMQGQVSTIDVNCALVTCLQSQKEILIHEEVKRKAEERPDSEFKQIENEMCQLDAAVVVPNFLEDKLLGILILGDKQSGKIYTSEDLYIFSVLANQSALAIENALLYGNIEAQVKERTAQLVEVQKQLIQAEKLATVGTLAGGVAHEINNPLTAVLTNVQMLLADADKLDSDSKESLELIEEATKRCRTIVQKLMVYAKKPQEQTQTHRVDLLKVVQNVISLLAYQLEQDNIKIILKKEDDSFYTEGNANELEQVFTNIILNAKDAIKKIRKNGTITISFSQHRGMISITVKDDGIGIGVEILPKIFDPFFTTKDVGKGLGLGLSICQAIVDKHNGKIMVQSEPGQGALFTVRLSQSSVPLSPEGSHISSSSKGGYDGKKDLGH
jgi:C4-dicarboxylate-specific signal transduction histidine kinase